MIMLEVMQKPMRTSMDIVNMDLGLKKGKGFWSFVQL